MKVDERFLQYVRFGTNSDEESETTPSSRSQFDLGYFLVEEMKKIGLANVSIDDKCYVYGTLPASEGCEREPAIGLFAHMDTSSAVPGDNIHPRKLNYQGGNIKLSDTVSITEEVFPFMKKYVGQDLIVTDGTTLLGADDKAGIAEILTSMEYLIAHPDVKHGRIEVGFMPDEEIGRGTDYFNMDRVNCNFAYTVDGGGLGELEYECFNGAGCKIVFNGVNIHPGSAKNKMVNAVLLANEFINLLPPAETPAHTEGYEGFYHICGIKGDESQAEMIIIIRDHDRKIFEDRKAFVTRAVDYMNEKYGQSRVKLMMQDTYYNMKEYIMPAFHVVERAKKAMEDAGVTPIIQPIRGGTDGAQLSRMGLPCPNLSTAGENYHGIHEFVSIQGMEKMVEIITNIVKVG